MEIGVVIAETPVPQSLEEDGARREEMIPIRADELASLEELEPPRKLRSDFDDFLANYEELIDLDQGFVEAAAAGDQAAADDATAEQVALGEENRHLAEDIGFEACAERLPRKEERKVRAVIEETLVNGDPDFCTEKYTENFVEAIGGLEACEEAESDPSNVADSVEIEGVRGIAEVYAVATVTPEGGPNDGEPGIIELEYEDGVYKRSALFAAPAED